MSIGYCYDKNAKKKCFECSNLKNKKCFKYNIEIDSECNTPNICKVGTLIKSRDALMFMRS